MIAPNFRLTSAFTLLFLLSSHLATAQSATPAGSITSLQSSATAAPKQSIDAARLVNELLPGASVTSLSPAQESKLAQDATVYFAGYTASNPLSKLAQDAAINQFLGGKSDPSPEQSSQIAGLLAQAPTAIINDPTGYVASINAAVSPFAFAGGVSTYADNLLQGLRTVVASDLSLPVPTRTSASRNGAAQVPLQTGVRNAALVAAAAGAVGAVML